MHAHFKKHILNFKLPRGTSRGVLNTKETFFLVVTKNDKKGVGECGLFKGLSVDDRPDYEGKLQWVCENIHLGEEKLWQELIEFPSIQFGVEMAFLSLKCENPFVLFPSKFTSGEKSIVINGLVWMGDEAFMKIYNQIKSNTLVDIYRCYELWQLIQKAQSLHAQAAILEVGVYPAEGKSLMTALA